MQKRCSKCGGYRFRSKGEQVVCRQCGEIYTRDYLVEKQLEKFREESKIEAQYELASLAT
jgi:uncharacterized Zn finger protein (UPF0148 family)